MVHPRASEGTNCSNNGSLSGARPYYRTPCDRIQVPNRECGFVLGTPEARPRWGVHKINPHSGGLLDVGLHPQVAAVWERSVSRISRTRSPPRR